MRSLSGAQVAVTCSGVTCFRVSSSSETSHVPSSGVGTRSHVPSGEGRTGDTIGVKDASPETS